MDGKPCSRCRVNTSLPHHRYCRECRNAYMRANRPKYSQLTDEQKLRASARAIANIYERRGVLRRPKVCQHCRDSGVELEKHHGDYSKPLAVIWLCKECHAKVSRPTPQEGRGTQADGKSR